jgi:hypothetical protein
MNPAPAELLQLLKSAALQLSSSPTTETTKVRWFTALFTPLPARARKEKAAMPELIQAMRLVLFAKLTCILNESASHFLIGLPPVKRAKKSACSRFDKFNHVKYTKTLSVRNPHTVFFVPFRLGEVLSAAFNRSSR